MIPLWMMDAGRSPESGFDKGLYEQLRSVYNDPISNRIIHWADVQGILAAFQDRLMAVINYLEVIPRERRPKAPNETKPGSVYPRSEG